MDKNVYLFTLVFTLALASAHAGFLPYHNDDHLIDHGISHHGSEFLLDDIRHGLHPGYSAQILLDGHHGLDQQAAVYHHADHHADIDIGHHDAGHHGVYAVDVQNAPAEQIIQHQPIHQVEPVHHITNVVHHEPHHFLHYISPVIDHHVVHKNQHANEHRHAADLHHDELHHGDLTHSGGLSHHADVVHHDNVLHHGDVHVHHADVLHHGDVLHHADVHHHGDALHHSDLLHHGSHHAAVVIRANVHEHAAVVHHPLPILHHHRLNNAIIIHKLQPLKFHGHGKIAKIKIIKHHD
uniref:Histidine-rich glycoprotein-like n=1 Tax=Stomoxys calcitrans TaxID=35570 RepID=A0A1I8Q3T2_STOCA